MPLVTPGPEYVPPKGIPPLSRKGCAFIVVIESLHRVKVTTGEEATPIVIVLLVAGFPLVQRALELRMQES